MYSKVLLALLIFFPLVIITSLSTTTPHSFSYNNGFNSTKLILDGLARITPNGILQLTNSTNLAQTGHAFNPKSFSFKNSSNGSAFSFSTYFVFSIVPDYQPLGGYGMTFVIAPTPGLPGGRPWGFIGLFNNSNNSNSSNHVIAIELDTNLNPDFQDINNNHVGIDINGMVSQTAWPAAYYDSHTGSFRNLTLNDRRTKQMWIDYDAESTLLNVTLAPIHYVKPSNPLLSYKSDLSSVLLQNMYVGFSAAPLGTRHYVLGWSFAINGIAEQLDLSKLPKLPRFGPKEKPKVLTIGLPLISIVLLLLVICSLAYYIRGNIKFSELIEEWEVDYIPQRYKYKDLYIATKGFKDTEILGTGGFGQVYKGKMPNSKTEIAVKRVSHESRQGIKEFIAEIVSIGRLRHRNLVSLLGYCRRKRELLLVYEYMANGSLDKYLHDQPMLTLTWDQRFQVIKGTASGLLYLHEEWEQVVVHRDIKASNILLDGEFNARLGDFGLARLYDHGSDPQTTHLVGTLGYLAPEHTRTGKATTNTDVYAFGAFLLEVVCGRRPLDRQTKSETPILIDWVLSLWSKGEIIEAVDSKLDGCYAKDEVKLILELGLLCLHSRPEMRPRMRQIMLYLTGDLTLPELSSLGITPTDIAFAHGQGFDDLQNSDMFTTRSVFSGSLSVSNSLVCSGR